jgi:hypothetical protein
MTEHTLHSQLKAWYAQPGDLLEESVDGYVIDIVRNDLLVEIQTGNFSSIKAKIQDLLENHRVRLIHPVAHKKWIIRLSKDERIIGRRLSPKRGRAEDVFYQLVYMPKLLLHKNLELEIVLVNIEEYNIDDGKGSWRRRGRSIQDRKLVDVQSQNLFRCPRDFLKLIPSSLPNTFTARELAGASGLRRTLAQKMVYSLRKMRLLEISGKRYRANLYRVAN